jgi:hypothetical protein
VVFALDGGGNGTFDSAMVFGAAAPKGENLHFSIPEGRYKGIMFAGTIKGFKLLAIGTVSAIIDGSGSRGTLDESGTIIGSDGKKYSHLQGNINNSDGDSNINSGDELKGYFELEPYINTIEFTLTSLSSNIQDKSIEFTSKHLKSIEEDSPSHNITGYEFTTQVRDKPNNDTKVNNRDVPFFFLPSRQDYAEYYDPSGVDSETAANLADGGIAKATTAYYNGDKVEEESSDDSITLAEGDMIEGLVGKWTVKGFGALPAVADLLQMGPADKAAALLDLTTTDKRSFISSTGVSGYNPLTDVIQAPVPVEGKVATIELKENGSEDVDLVVSFELNNNIASGLRDGLSKLRIDIPVQAFTQYGKGNDDGIGNGYVWHIVNGLEPSVIDAGDNGIGQEILLAFGEISNANDITVVSASQYTSDE